MKQSFIIAGRVTAIHSAKVIGNYNQESKVFIFGEEQEERR